MPRLFVGDRLIRAYFRLDAECRESEQVTGYAVVKVRERQELRLPKVSSGSNCFQSSIIFRIAQLF